ncbi:hypothetical protein V8C86DRAFT_2919518 [Haematococcus lacustris]
MRTAALLTVLALAVLLATPAHALGKSHCLLYPPLPLHCPASWRTWTYSTCLTVHSPHHAIVARQTNLANAAASAAVSACASGGSASAQTPKGW